MIKEPAGDYGYDLVHEVDKGLPGSPRRRRPRRRTRCVRLPSSTRDYGYDEAHDL